MRSIILAQTGRIMVPALVVMSLWVLYRGHNLPGGGFIGGLLFASGFALVAISDGVAEARRRLRFSPILLIATGLIVCLGSGLPAVLSGDAYMKALWLPAFSLPLLGKVHLGTPLVFDIGVYLTVIGFTLKVFFNLCEGGDA